MCASCASTNNVAVRRSCRTNPCNPYIILWEIQFTADAMEPIQELSTWLTTRP